MSTPPARSPAVHALQLAEPVRTELERSARRSYPREACGLLIGRFQGHVTSVEHVHAARNLASAPDRFELDPVDHLAAEDRARDAGLEVVGVWHSHPNEPAVPSDLDRAQAFGGWSYAIVSVVAGALVELRAWRLEAARFVEVEVRV
jgi:proteasome lid subunit RPN8/RPN11